MRNTSSGPVRRVVVLGGGTAGWLTAARLAADHCAADEGGLSVTLIESPDAPILGVGEGAWPSLRDTLRRIGLPETEFLRRCQASFKQGTRFDGWRTGGADDVYYHPFTAPPSADDADALALWRAAPAGTPFAFAVSPQPALCAEGRAPKQAGTPEYAAVANYAYHLDAGAFAELLCEHGVGRLGVRHIRDHVTGVAMRDDGDLRGLVTREHGEIEGDLFVDGSGARAVLIGEQLGAPLTDVSDVLFNDRALAVQVPYADADAPVASQTIATARDAGWVWDIGLATRRGVGYVFASRHAGEDEARAGLEAYLGATAPDAGLTGDDARLIAFTSGYREAPWTRNCVAIGMAAGFVEPLEASAIVMIELAAGLLSDLLPPTRGSMEGAARRFNARVAYRWTRIVDFLKLHYALSARAEPYWAAHRDRETWPERLAELLDRWRHEPPSREDFTDALEIFPAASHAYVLYGMGYDTARAPTRRRKDDPAALRRILEENRRMTDRFLAGLPTNRGLLDHIHARGLTRV